MNECSACNNDILKHNNITLIACLSSLSGEIEVYRAKIIEDEKK